MYRALLTAMTATLVSSCFDVHAHGNHADTNSMRLWRDSRGKVIREGAYVAEQGNQILLQDREGAFVSMDVARLGDEDRAIVAGKREQALAINTTSIRETAAVGAARVPSNSSPYLALMQRAFGAFEPKVRTRSDARYFHVESNSMPDHQMMVGITAWQQQVPIPQPFTGENSWKIPLHPVKAARPMSAKEHFFRGAIALAVNGVPIFNPIKNDGRTDTLKAGELDRWGGHCGRADDYHYHIAPTHLQNQVGTGNPVAFALDGYPVYGFREPDGTPVRNLDWMGGHTDKNGRYHYHALKKYPYLVGGFRGEVREIGGQVDPQPRGSGIRPFTRPLRGATITGFTGDPKSGYRLRYSQNGRNGFVNYKVLENGSATFQYIDTFGKTTTETYQRKQRGAERGPGDPRRGKGKGGKGGRPPRRDGERPPPRRPGGD